MKDSKSHDLSDIESLLAGRQQLTEWLERLEEAGSRAPESVRTKVRADYQGRLAQVVNQLGAHRDVINTTLEGLRAQSQETNQLRREQLEVRAEAELRHAVGEYSDDQWQLIDLETTGRINGLEHELEKLAEEIRRLAEVYALIAPPQPEQRPAASVERRTPSGDLPSAERRAPSVEPRVSEPESPPVPTGPRLVSDDGLTPAPRPEAPRFVPRGAVPAAREPAQPRAPRVTPMPAPASQGADDELAFLRSVNVEIEASPHPAATNQEGSGQETEVRKGPTAAKTLKCGECGSLNRPTEWYCERCGAELAAV
ncbi:MAG: hypothetical protein ACT4PM_01390 [Gemmatimonadales bacterium]